MADVRAAGQDTRAAAKPADGPLHLALIAIVCGVLLMAFGDVAAKSLFDHMSIWELSIIRGAGAMAILVSLAVAMPKSVRLKTDKWPYLLLRSSLMFVAFIFFFTSLPLMTMVEATALFYTAPLIITLLSAVYLRERVGPYRLGAVAVGFFGVALVTGWNPDQIKAAYLLPLGCALAYAHGIILTRGIKGDVSPWAFGIWSQGTHASFSVIGYVVAQAFVAPLVAEGATLEHLVFPMFSVVAGDFWLLVPVMIAASITHVLSAYAYRNAPVAVITPFEYSYLIWAAVIAFFLLGEIPTLRAASGLALIAGAGLFVAYRERKVRDRAAASGGKS